MLTTNPRIPDTVKPIFSNSIFAKVMKQYDVSALVQVYRLLNMLTVARYSEMRFFRHLTNHIFPSLYIGNVIFFFLKYFNILCRFQICSKKLKKLFCFLGSCSSIGFRKFFLFPREYLSSAVNGLTNTPRISNTLRATFINSIFAKVMKQYDGSSLLQFFRLVNILTVARCSQTSLFRHLTNHIFRSL